MIRFCCVFQYTKQRDALEESTPYNGNQLTFASSPAPRLKSMENLTAGNRPSRECPLARRSTHAATLVNEQRIVWCLFTVLVHLFDGRKPIEKPCLFSGTTWRILAWCHKGADPQRSPAVAAASSRRFVTKADPNELHWNQRLPDSGWHCKVLSSSGPFWRGKLIGRFPVLRCTTSRLWTGITTKLRVPG